MHPVSDHSSSRARAQVRQLRELIFTAPIEWILHVSDARLRVIGLLFIFGEPVYWFLWTFLAPQRVESIGLRFMAMALAVPLLMSRFWAKYPSEFLGRYFALVFFLNVPFSFGWLYAGNNFSWMWLSTCVCGIYILFLTMDWRVALLNGLFGTIAGVAFGWAVAHRGLIEMPTHDVLYSQLFVLTFSLVTGSLLAASGANMRLERLKASLATLAIMAHEFRTPFAAAGLLVDQVLLEADELPASKQQETIARAARQLVSIQVNVNNLINAQLVNARYMEPLPPLSSLDMSEQVRTAIDTFPFASTAEQERIAVDLEPGMYLQAHPEIFRHVIYNLLGNARLAVSKARPILQPGDIQITLARSDHHAVLTIEDKGCGMSKQQLERLFDPYQSTQTQLAHGLGLAMVKRSIEQMRGKVRCTSAEGIGTTFKITLPLGKSKAMGAQSR